jgi:membrane protease YdiL (CAAX protease family)
LGRAILLIGGYVLLGGFILIFSVLGKRPWTGFGVFLALTGFFQVHLSRRPWSELGIRFNAHALVEGLGGALAGTVLFSLAVAGLLAAGAITLQRNPLISIPREAVVLLATLALLEELFFRGYPLVTLSRAIGPIPALLASSVLFTAAHLYNPNFGPLPALGIFLAGAVMSAAFLRWRSLWLTWSFHAFWNASQSLLYGFPTSGLNMKALDTTPVMVARIKGPTLMTGGGFGPEGGLPVLLLLMLALGGILCWPGGPTLEQIQECLDARFQAESELREAVPPSGEKSNSFGDEPEVSP